MLILERKEDWFQLKERGCCNLCNAVLIIKRFVASVNPNGFNLFSLLTVWKLEQIWYT